MDKHGRSKCAFCNKRRVLVKKVVIPAGYVSSEPTTGLVCLACWREGVDK